MKRSLFAIAFVTMVMSCQKSVSPEPEPTGPEVLSSIETEQALTSGSSTQIKSVDSIIYSGNRQTGLQMSRYTNGLLSSSERDSYIFEPSRIIFANKGGLQYQTATVDPVTGNITSLIHIPNFKVNTTDSLYKMETKYSYGASGFLARKEVVSIKVTRNGGIRILQRANNATDYTNDGTNINRFVFHRDETDSLFLISNGAFVSSVNRFYRETNTLTFQPGKYVPVSTDVYKTGKPDAQLMASQTMTSEVSTDRGITWKPGDLSLSRTMTYELTDSILKKSINKTVGAPDVTKTYKYIKL